MIYGYQLREVNEDGLLELREVSFVSEPDTLRDLSRFFALMADAMDSGDFEQCSHRHIGSVIANWSATHKVDVVVCGLEGDSL